MIGGSDPDTGRTPLKEQAGLLSPAHRFGEKAPPSDSSAGRMVDRVTNMIGDDPVPENEFGLPSQPTIGLPTHDAPSLEAPVLPGDLPGSETAELAPPLEDPLLEVPSLEQSPDIEVPGLTDPLTDPSADPLTEIPGVVDIEVPTADEPQIPGAPSIGAVPQLPDGPAPPDPIDEVPGIIPPPSDTAESIPALPPGLEPLPGSQTGALRRPGGLIEPRDTDVLPPPDRQNLRQRLQRLEGVLTRAPSQNLDRYGKPRKPTPEPSPTREGTPRAAPAQPVETLEREPQDPLLEIPKGLASRSARSVVSDRPSTDEILRRARESEGVRAERTAQAARTGFPKVNTPRPLEPSGHQLPLPDKDISTRDEPSSRMMARLSNLTGDDPYKNEDIHGLPIVRATIDGQPQPRKEIAVEQLPESREEIAAREITKLARFFRGNQEEEAGMRPPPAPVAKEPLPRVIDNLLPENDPARNRVVDDKLLDLRGVEYQRPGLASGEESPASAPRRPEKLNENFLDKLTNVLGEPAETIPQPTISGPEPGTIGLENLNVPDSQLVKPAKPAIPDPWTMTVERKDAGGQSTTLGVTAISPEDGSEITPEEGVVSGMVGRIRQLLSGPNDTDKGPAVDSLDEQERQAAAERVLSEALRDGAPTALPDQGQWPVTEVETLNATPGVPPKPRPGVLTRTSLDDIVLSLGESVTLENTLPPQQDGIDPLNSCIKKNRGTTLFCVEPVDWPEQLRTVFVVPTILYTGPMAITRYDQGSPSRFHVLFDAEKFEDVVAYYQVRYGEPTEIWKRSIAPLAKPRMDNPTVTWRSRDNRSNVITVLEIRKFDDTRGGFPDTNRGAVMLYHFNAPSIFPQVSSHELMRLRRANR